MSLRRSPRRTAAFLTANRANAQKSTGPHTAPGKQRSAAHALRTGKRASPAFWRRVLSHSELAGFHALRDAIGRAVSAGGENQNSESQKQVGAATRLVWSVRRYAERYLRTMPPDARRQMAKRLIPAPRCWHRAIPGPAWKVTVTVFARRGRRSWCDRSSIPTIGPAVGSVQMPEAKPARVHVITRVTCTGHPGFNRGPEGVPLSLKPGAKPPEIRTNPECFTKQEAYRNIAPNADSHGAGEAQGVDSSAPLSGRSLRVTAGRRRKARGSSARPVVSDEWQAGSRAARREQAGHQPLRLGPCQFAPRRSSLVTCHFFQGERDKSRDKKVTTV